MKKIFLFFKLFINGKIFVLIKTKFQQLTINNLRAKNFFLIKDFINECRSTLKKKYKKKNEKGYLLVEGMWDNPIHWLRMALLKPSIEMKYGLKTLLLNLEGSNKEMSKILNYLRYDKEKIIPKKFSPNYITQASKLVRSLKKKEITDENLYNLKFPNSYPAFYFFDEVLKKNAIGDIKSNNVDYIYFIAKTLFFLDFYKNLIKKEKIKVAIVSHQITIRYSTLIWLLLQKKVPVYLTNYYNGHIIIKKITKKNQILKPFDDVFCASDFKKLESRKKKKIIKKSNKYIDNLKKGLDGELSFFKIHKNSSLKCKNKKQFFKRLKIKNNYPVAIVFANCWTDYPSGYGKNPFSSYVAWFEFILKNIDKIKKINWIIKPHPGESFYGEKITCKKIIDRVNPKNIYLWPHDLTNIEVEKYADYIISARSSSTLEYGVKGKKVICSFPSPFSQFKFVTFASNKISLLRTLKNLRKISKSKQNAIVESQLFSYSFLGDYNLNKYPKYPYGAESNKIYKYLPEFLKKNKKKLKNECLMINKWVSSNHDRYNVFKLIND